MNGRMKRAAVKLISSGLLRGRSSNNIANLFFSFSIFYFHRDTSIQFLFIDLNMFLQLRPSPLDVSDYFRGKGDFQRATRD